MTPSPKETVIGEKEAAPPPGLTGEEIVISGISGIFPGSENVLEFMENLYNKVDMVASEGNNWNFSHPEVPNNVGMIKGKDKFDAQFFKVAYSSGVSLDPGNRILMEHAYGAITDSGTTPVSLRGKNVGVFVGTTYSDSGAMSWQNALKSNGFMLSGYSKTMFANRISYWLDAKSPSYALDLTCASSTACLEHAYRSMKAGECDAALVGGSNICIHPMLSLNMKKAGLLCLDGKTKCFDKNGDGYVRSEAVSMIFLQKAKDAKRIYSEVYYVKGTFGMRPDAQFLPLRESNDIKDFLEDFYSDIDVSPKDVEYIEAHGSAIAKADGEELEAIGEVFARKNSVKVGSVKSNMGHSEPASGVCALTKICLAYHQGKLPANLHYSEPHDISAVQDGRIQVLNENTAFNRGFVALNNFSYTGTDFHVLLKGHYKKKNIERYTCSIPRLVLVSGRQDNGVKKTINLLKETPIDPEQIGLLHSTYIYDIPGHTCRGYTILDTNEEKETVSLAESTQYYAGGSNPVWLVFSGMGSQWAGMGAELMRIPIFAAAIHRCHKALEPKGVDLVRVLTEKDDTIYDNILNCFIGIAAVQIGLIDIIKEMGIVPDNIIGHSAGEMACSYFDGSFTAEEMILSAYSRGYVSATTSFTRGGMAAVGLGYKAVLPLCPPDIDVACHNSSESATISGPADSLKEFVADLSNRKIFAKEVPSSNIAFHSRYIAHAAPEFMRRLKEGIKTPKLRSEKWISTSVPQDRWDENDAKYSSAEYHTNNLLNPVLFEEVMKFIPSNAIVIEVAPHGLLQAILKRSLNECTHVPLTKRGHSDPVTFLLQAIGKLYEAGLNPKVDILYPKIEYPVATETPILSHFVEWEHSEDWPIARYNMDEKMTSMSREFVMSVHDDEYKYFGGHKRNGVTVFPESGYLVLIWETLAMYKSVNYEDLSVVFRNIEFHGEVAIKEESPIKLDIMIHKGNNKFEISYEENQIVSGFVHDTKDVDMYKVDGSQISEDDLLSSEDIYRLLHLKGYSYRNEFQSISSSNLNRNKATVNWTQNWVTFIDSLIQFNTFARDYEGLSKIKFIKSIAINIQKHRNNLNIIDNDVYCDVELFNVYKVISSGGVELRDIVYNDLPIVEEQPDILAARKFVPYFSEENVQMDIALQINLQIIVDNINSDDVQITELSTKYPTLSSIVKQVVGNIPKVNFNINTIKINDDAFNDNQYEDTVNVIITENFVNEEQKFSKIYNSLHKDAFVISLEDRQISPDQEHNLSVISSMTVQNKKMYLLQKPRKFEKNNITFIPIDNRNKSNWISKLQSEVGKSNRIILVSEKQSLTGIEGYVKRLKKVQENVGVVIIEDNKDPSFKPGNEFYIKQLQKNLTFNVLKEDKWGSYHYLPTATSSDIRDVILTSKTSGDFDSLTWIERAPSSNKTSIKVSYSGLSLKDCQQCKSDSTFGMDFSGTDDKGQRVMGVIPGGAISSVVEADPDLLWPVPEHWSLEDAATVPLPYLLAYYCLIIRSKLKEGQRVFVNGGTGALAQAVISICLAMNCTVFTTVSDVKKKEFLLELFPKLDEKNIAYSRHATFHKTVICNTDNKRCDIVINGSTGSLRQAAIKCVGFMGFFLDVSHSNINDIADFGMFYLMDDRAYMAVQLSTIFRPENLKDKKILQLEISEGVKKGIVRPLTRVVYSPLDVSRAFRLISSSRHRGRVLIDMRDPTVLTKNLNITPRMSFDFNGTYVIVCDESGLGIEVASRLIKRGARKIVINLPSNHLSTYTTAKSTSWESDVSLKLLHIDLQTEKGCINLLQESTQMGPVLGIFVVQNSKAFDNKNNHEKDITQGINVMASVIINLDLTSRNCCPELRYFVVIARSSNNLGEEYLSSLTNNTCQIRTELGLPALAFHIESLDEFDKETDNKSKVPPQSVATVLNALETSLKLKLNNVITFNSRKRITFDFVAKIEKILGLKNINDIDENLIISEINVSELVAEEIKTTIKDAYEINFTTEAIQNMSITSLKNLSNGINIKNNKEVKGLKAFYSFVDKNECMATEPMIPMPTKYNNVVENDENRDPTATYLMMIPGFEGHHQIFKSICERLKIRAMAVQLSPELTEDTIPEMAKNIVKSMKMSLELTSKFYLLGYSFGVNVALEVAALMERGGRTGVVYCLDSSPDVSKLQLNAFIGKLKDNELQNAVLEHMVNLMAGDRKIDVKDISEIEEWSEKVEACINKLRHLVTYSHQYMRAVIHTAYRRIKLAQEYEPNYKLNSELVLMKGVPHPKMQYIADDYNLSKYTKHPVKIFNIAADHVSAPEDCRVPNIVNRLLDSKLLEEFNRKNLCTTYITDMYKIE